MQPTTAQITYSLVQAIQLLRDVTVLLQVLARGVPIQPGRRSAVSLAQAEVQSVLQAVLLAAPSQGLLRLVTVLSHERQTQETLLVETGRSRRDDPRHRLRLWHLRFTRETIFLISTRFVSPINLNRGNLS